MSEFAKISEEIVHELSEKLLSLKSVDISVYAKPSLERRLLRICELNSFTQIDELLPALDEPSFLSYFISELTVGVTEMFRDPEAWVYLKNEVLSKLLPKKETIKVWHCGCSTGEEVYTLKILFDELNALSKLEQLATDINEQFLGIAQEAIYSYRKIELYERNYAKFNPHNKFSQYYRLNKYNAHIEHYLKPKVTFKTHDLTSEEMEGSFDLIFCRNVLIYFEQDLQEKLLAHFYALLKPGGWLMLGQYESLVWCDHYNRFEQPDPSIGLLRKL